MIINNKNKQIALYHIYLLYADIIITAPPTDPAAQQKLYHAATSKFKHCLCVGHANWRSERACANAATVRSSKSRFAMDIII